MDFEANLRHAVELHDAYKFKKDIVNGRVSSSPSINEKFKVRNLPQDLRLLIRNTVDDYLSNISDPE